MIANSHNPQDLAFVLHLVLYIATKMKIAVYIKEIIINNSMMSDEFI